MQKILIATSTLQNIGGSELVALELAELYTARGWHADFYTRPGMVGGTLEIDEPGSIFHDSADLDLEQYSIVWIHHNMLPAVPVHSAQQVVCHHMGPYHEAEKAHYQPYGPTHIFAVSEETRSALPPQHRDRCKLLRNPAPPWFMYQDRTNRNPSGLALHVSQADIPSPYFDGVHVDRIGLPYEVFRVMPATLRPYDFVICNGKTVQYCLRMGIPVYLWDLYGGPGWLNSANYAEAERHNFSGRGQFGANVSAPPLNPDFLSDDTRFHLEVRLEEEGLL